jgi:hypothetical protein
MQKQDLVAATRTTPIKTLNIVNLVNTCPLIKLIDLSIRQTVTKGTMILNIYGYW